MVFPHIARQVSAPAELANSVLNAVVSARAERPHGNYERDVVGGWIVLAVCGPVTVPPRADIVWPVRQTPGLLALGWRRIPIELEVTPWSDLYSEISIRATGPRAKGDVRGYVAAVSDALDRLTREVLDVIASLEAGAVQRDRRDGIRLVSAAR